MLLRQIYFLPGILMREWKRKEEIEKAALRMLKSLLKDVYHTNPFYKKKLEGLDITGVKTISDLSPLPFTTKNEMREAFPRNLSSGYCAKNCIVESTSGSTGDVLDVYHDTSAYDYYDCIGFRAYKGYDYRLKYKIAYTRFDPVKKELFEYFGLFERYNIPVYYSAQTQLNLLLKYNPEVISAYPSFLHEVARLIEEERSAAVPRPKFIVSHSELLTNPAKAYIESVFDCPVYRDYASFEVHCIANECTHGGMHIHLDSTIVEIIKDGKPAAPGEIGEIVVTNLRNRAMPFIRYKTGDIGAFDEDMCSCGRGLPLLKMIEGRKDEYLILPSGEKISPRIFDLLPYMFHDYISKFQIIQKKKNRIILKIVKKEKYNEKTENMLIAEIRKYLGELIEIHIVDVDNIERTGRGKFRAVINEIAK
jgi:phenylacetate-CoA ligase